MYIIPFSANFISPFAFCISLNKIFSTSSPTYPASVTVVASAIAKGTFKALAKVLARRVLPLPVGPIKRTFDFSNSTSFLSSLF